MQQLPEPMEWLAAGIPLSLLIDLYDASGPRSETILEREPADADWIPMPAHAA